MTDRKKIKFEKMRISSTAGTSLVTTLVALAISGIIIATVADLFVQQNKQLSSLREKLELISLETRVKMTFQIL